MICLFFQSNKVIRSENPVNFYVTKVIRLLCQKLYYLSKTKYTHTKLTLLPYWALVIWDYSCSMYFTLAIPGFTCRKVICNNMKLSLGVIPDSHFN